MSSPTRYYASTPRAGSRTPSRPTSPSNPAEVRSQAIAKLKRAASIPRQADGRRQGGAGTPDQQQQQHHQQQQQQHASVQYASINDPGPSSYVHPVEYHDYDQTPTKFSAHGDVEVLSPSPTAPTFPPSAFFNHPSHGHLMQRSASASSSYHVSSHSNSGYGQPMSAPFAPSPDWAAMQLAHSMLPSLSPSAAAFPVGRNTPSPLPTLGELASLQRSNSAAARAQAMSKLTGGRNTPSDEDVILGPGRPELHRADTLAAPGMLGAILARRVRTPQPEDQARTASAAAIDEDQPVFQRTIGESRPRLQRSYTVSSSNLGEERRSVVGRRMMERLGKRPGTREKEEEEVRQLWQQRRAEAERQSNRVSTSESDTDGGGGVTQEEADDERSVTAQGYHDTTDSEREEHLVVQDRPPSRATTTSVGEAFEYSGHLRRSMSSRTARNAPGLITEAVPNIHAQSPENVQEQLQSPIVGESGPPVLAPAIHTPVRPGTGVVSSEPADHGSSPSAASTSTRDPLNSIMFVVGGHRSGESFPVEVSNGSEWGTPAKDLSHPTFSETPGHSPLVTQAPRQPSTIGSDTEGTKSSRRGSVMSWEEVGGAEDQEVPSDARYHKKSGSISAKIGRSMRQAIRKRSNSRGSTSSNTGKSPPTSPRILTDGLIKTFSRRGSASSISHSAASTSQPISRTSPMPFNGHDRSPSHQASISSISGASYEPLDSANSALIQHQLSAEQVHRVHMPRADISDHRINHKLSPFPGFAQLEEKARRGSDEKPEAPKLQHQSSDPVVPSQTRVAVQGESIYSLPLPVTEDGKRGSADSSLRRGWLAKAFGQTTSPRSSGSVSRKSSNPDIVLGAVPPKSPGLKGHIAGSSPPDLDSDPFAPPPPPPVATPRVKKKTSASPCVSVVPEGSEEGSRLTRFTARPDLATQEEVSEAEETTPNGLSQRSMDVLNRMDDLLALGPDDPARPDILDDPPRKLLLSTQILQVVNIHTAKDRYLFLFNDILVITKPLITHGIHANLDMQFLVKSVVPLDELSISGFREEASHESDRHSVVQKFIGHFAQDPEGACRYLVQRSNPKVDAMTLASLIFKTSELDKTQVGILLAGNEVLMRAFIDRFHFTGVRIDDALRMFLLALRLPTEPTACEGLLRGFAYRYFEANKDTIPFNRDLATELVLAIMQLNDALYGTFGFALPNHAITQDIFISAFNSKDTHHSVPDSLLADIYTSIRQAKLAEALAAEDSGLLREVLVTPARLPSRLTYNTWSDPIYISIPKADPVFKIKLHGDGLEFDPPVLDFSISTEEAFRVRGVGLGAKSILFERQGVNAPLYSGLGNTRTFTIERAFMRHTFQVGFTSHVGVKRKYCFSLPDAAAKERWGTLLQRQVAATRLAKSTPPATHQQRVRLTAEAVALQVLRDALIPLEDTPSAIEVNGPSNGTGRTKGPDKPKPRSGSVSIAYGALNGLGEEALGPLVAPNGKTNGHVEDVISGGGGGMAGVQTGKEMVLLCRQNSLLPGLLELLQAGKERPRMPLTPTTASNYENGTAGVHNRTRSAGVRI